jgi:ornithine cyclodeaminase/alanine dehydrogenase-like protein (mu-crystallin family)
MTSGYARRMGFERVVRILRRDDVRASLDMGACIEACERAFASYSGGGAEVPGVIHLDVQERSGEIHVKAGHLHGSPHYAVKVASGFPRNVERGLPASDGMVIVFDAENGAPAAFLLDQGYITDLRTGAAGGVAARYLAPEQVHTVAVIGTGAQARYQLDALAIVRPGFTSVRVWGRDAEHAATCVGELRLRPGLPPDCSYEVSASVEDAVHGADVVITCTASRTALVRDEWLKPGAHVTAVGSDGPDKQELDPSVPARADLLVVDSREQSARIGELHHALAAGLIDARKAIELGEICALTHPGRTSPDQLTVCDLTGVGVQDVAAANVVMANVGDRGDLFTL